MKLVEFQSLIKLQAFRVTGTWEHRIRKDSEGICREITQAMTSNDKINRVLQLLGFVTVPKPYDAAFLSIMVEPIRQFQMYFFLTERSDTNFFFYFNPQSTRLIHGEDVIGWVGMYIRLLGRAFKSIDSLGVKIGEKFYFSSRVPKTKQNHLYALTRRDLEPICAKHNYLLEFKAVSQWQVTINQCPGLILQIKCCENHVQYGYRAARALTKEPPSEGLTTIALLHLNHILRQAGKESVL